MFDFVWSVLSRLVTRFLSPRPEIRKEGGILIIESTWRTALLTLGGRHRKVTVDPKMRVLRIRDRTFWFVSKDRRIEFDWLDEIVYTYRDLLESNWVSHASQDLFTVGLRLKNGERITLFRLYGEGEYINNSVWPDWMMWDEILPGQIVQHRSEGIAARVAEVLSGLTGAPIGNDLP